MNEANGEENKEKTKKKLEQEESEIEKKASEEAANSIGTRRSGLELVYYTQVHLLGNISYELPVILKARTVQTVNDCLLMSIFLAFVNRRMALRL